MNQATVDRVSLPEARFLALVAQCLEDPVRTRRPKTTQDAILAVIRTSGCVQLDSISVVSRAHETAIWSRLGSFDHADLTALQYPRMDLIEYWAHAASLLPVEFLPFLRRAMLRYADPANPVGKWIRENRSLVEDVLCTIERDGPLTTRAFERPEEFRRNPWDWWGGKPAKQALDYLWTVGELVILRRAGFERVYEVTDRAFPGLRDMPLPDRAEEARFFTERALRAVGVGTLPWIADYFRCGSSRFVSVPDMRAALEELKTKGVAVLVELEGASGPAWLDAKLLDHLSAFRSGSVRPRQKTLLSPFDNLLWRRDRASALFRFDYRLESYTPKPKRVYGYYSLPILIDGRLVGRLDATYRRKERRMDIWSIHLEPAERPSAGLCGSLAKVIRDFTDFLGGGDVQIIESYPESLRPELDKHMS